MTYYRAWAAAGVAGERWCVGTSPMLLRTIAIDVTAQRRPAAVFVVSGMDSPFSEVEQVTSQSAPVHPPPQRRAKPAAILSDEYRGAWEAGSGGS